MITHIGSAMLYVSDQEESLAFYRDLLGFSIVLDADMGGGARWLELAPPDGSTTITLHHGAPSRLSRAQTVIRFSSTARDRWQL